MASCMARCVFDIARCEAVGLMGCMVYQTRYKQVWTVLGVNHCGIHQDGL